MIMNRYSGLVLTRTYLIALEMSPLRLRVDTMYQLFSIFKRICVVDISRVQAIYH